MNAHWHSHRIASKGIFVLIVCLLALQSHGMSGLAASSLSPRSLQQGGTVFPLECSTSSITPTPTYCDIQIVLLIDDSGSMRTNDPQKGPAGGLRNQGARNLVDVLARQYYLPVVQLKADRPDVRLPDVRVAVVHFSETVKAYSEDWIQINPSSPEDWEAQRGELDRLIDWRNNYATMQYTHFIEPFEKAAELFGSKSLPAQEGGCTRRSILLFTDGTPEDRQGILQGQGLDDEMTRVRSIIQDDLAGLEVKVYVTGFKIDPGYWGNVEPHWVDIVGAPAQDDLIYPALLQGQDSLVQLASRMEKITASMMGVQSFALTPDTRDPQLYSIEIPDHIHSLRLTFYHLDPQAGLQITGPDGTERAADGEVVTVAGEETSIEVWELHAPLAGSYQVRASKPGGIITALLTYQHLSGQSGTDSTQLQVGQPGEIQFTLVDESGLVVLPADQSLQLNVSVAQGAQEFPVEWTGDAFQFSWTPKKAGRSQFEVAASLVSASGDELLDCSGTLEVDVPLPPPGPDETLSMAVTSACMSLTEGATLPVQLDYEGEDQAWASSLQWDVSAKANPNPRNERIDVQINTVDAAGGRYELRIDPITDGAGVREVVVSATAQITGRTAEIADSETFTVPLCLPPPCDCDIWRLWFWPLLILLAALLIALLVLRFRTEPTEKEQPEEKRDLFRTGFWHLLFWPLLILFILLILTRLFWCCWIPPWLFLVLLLILLLIGLLLWFFPKGESRTRRPWWLVILLVLLVLIWFLFFRDHWIYLLWFLLFLFFLIWIIGWYKSRERPLPVWWLLVLLTFLLSIWLVFLGSFPLWLILIWLLMWLVILLIGWLISRNDEWAGTWQFWLLVIAGAALAVLWFIFFTGYRIHLLWMLPLALLLFWFISRSRREGETHFAWWLLILLTLIASIWIILFGGFPFWLILLLLLTWAGILVLVWIFSRDIVRRRSPQPWVVLGLVLILLLLSFIFFSEYWTYLLLWLLVFLVLVWIILWILPYDPQRLPPMERDDLTIIEGIGPGVEKLLNEHGIYTFNQLSATKVEDLNAVLDKTRWAYMDPKTWPHQAELAEAMKSGAKEDQDKFNEFVAHMKDGIPPEEYNQPEKTRRPPDEPKEPR